MAKYYYDRYRVNSSTTYTWTKYNADYYYYLGSWGSSELVSSGVTHKFGGSSYSIYQRGQIRTSGSKTIYSSGTGGVEHVVYEVASDGQTLYRYFFSTSNLYRQSASLISEITRGSFISTVRSTYSFKSHNQLNSDGYWWVRGSSSTSYSRGSFIDTIIAEDGTYPDNGRVGTTYWYIKRNKAFPDFKVKADGQLRTAEEGWVKVNGILRPIEQMWVKDNGSLKEV